MATRVPQNRARISTTGPRYSRTGNAKSGPFVSPKSRGRSCSNPSSTDLLEVYSMTQATDIRRARRPRPRLLDLFCCQGGAGKGYDDVGFDVTGVDKDPQPRYPFRFVQADAIAFVLEHGAEFDFIHASPPCQFDSDCQRLQGNTHPDLIHPTRAALETTGRPWVIENVGGAVPKLHAPVMLCGTMFHLATYRHRFLEA